jgi:hypothetical protein
MIAFPATNQLIEFLQGAHATMPYDREMDFGSYSAIQEIPGERSI